MLHFAVDTHFGPPELIVHQGEQANFTCTASCMYNMEWQLERNPHNASVPLFDIIIHKNTSQCTFHYSGEQQYTQLMEIHTSEVVEGVMIHCVISKFGTSNGTLTNSTGKCFNTGFLTGLLSKSVKFLAYIKYTVLSPT